MKVMPPLNLQMMDDAYQSVEVLSTSDAFVEFDVTLYPLRSLDEISGNLNWKAEDASMQEFLQPGVTTHWDTHLQTSLLSDLQDAGINPDVMDDKSLVEQVSTWAMRRSTFINMFDTFFTYFPDGAPAVFPGLQQVFTQNMGDASWSTEDQFNHELLGDQMYFNKTYGTCTSFATYQATILRALGIPTRIVLMIPIADPSDPAQITMVDSGIQNADVRAIIDQSLKKQGQSFSSHTFNEVYIGHQWVRLNYNALGQPILDKNYLGLMMHVNTFNDLSEAHLAETWGVRYGEHLRSADFPSSNPYRAMEISDKNE